MKKVVFILLLLTPFAGSGQVITTVAGGGAGGLGDGGPATAAKFGWFGYLATDFYGNVYVADANNHRVRKVDVATGVINTIAGTGMAGYNGDNIPATAAQLNYPTTIALDSQKIYT
jgi:hypothetical protein